MHAYRSEPGWLHFLCPIHSLPSHSLIKDNSCLKSWINKVFYESSENRTPSRPRTPFQALTDPNPNQIQMPHQKVLLSSVRLACLAISFLFLTACFIWTGKSFACSVFLVLRSRALLLFLTFVLRLVPHSQALGSLRRCLMLALAWMPVRQVTRIGGWLLRYRSHRKGLFLCLRKLPCLLFYHFSPGLW